MSIIKTEGLTYVYGENTPFRKVALDNVDLEINECDTCARHTGSHPPDTFSVL